MKMNKVLQFSLLLCVILTASAFAAESSAPTYSDNFKYDVVRGSTNIVAAPYEIYTTTKEHHLNKGPEQNKGITNEKRIGLMGHSWGGYQTAFLVTQTNLFSAAVAGAPLTNMISMYNSIYWNSGTPDQQIFETSQGRLREPYWKLMDEYIANSPMFQAQNIQTPLLVTFGDNDGAVDWHQGIEMYTTMRRMEKPMILLVYAGENHGLAKKENQMDYAAKVNQYFNHHLNGGKAEPWITEGQTILEKKKLEEQKNKVIKP
jgi:esterase/lipase